MTYFEDLTDYRGQSGIKTIGWLERGHAFDTSLSSKETLDLLWNFCTISALQTRGRHCCDLCEPTTPVDAERDGVSLALGSAEIRAFSPRGIVYAAPTLIFHYVSVHHYKPPDEFLQALREGPKPPSLEYFALLDPDWNRTHTTEHTQSYREGIRIYGELAKTNPAYLPYLAESLEMLGFSASRSHLPDQADQSYEEAIDIFRRLAKDNPADYAHKLAGGLSSLGRHYLDTRRLKEAEKVYQEALEVYREVASESPEYLIFVEGMLGFLRRIYNDTQRPEEAKLASEEAKNIRRVWQAKKLPIPWRH